MGVSVTAQQEAFVFHPGPVFAQVLLADDQPRRTERGARAARGDGGAAGVGGNETRAAQARFVIATQNPTDQLGAYPLLNRSSTASCCASRSATPTARRSALLVGEDRREAVTRLPAVMLPDNWRRPGGGARGAGPEALLDHLQSLIAATRSGQWFVEGLSPRASIAVLRVAKGAR